MKITPEHNERMAKLDFSDIYPLYLEKVKKKGRTKAELDEVIAWLTGFDKKKIQELSKQKITFKEFFEKANLNPNAHLITGVICGYRIEEIDNELTRKVRYLDKVVDELARGKEVRRVLRGYEH